MTRPSRSRRTLAFLGWVAVLSLVTAGTGGAQLWANIATVPMFADTVNPAATVVFPEAPAGGLPEAPSSLPQAAAPGREIFASISGIVSDVRGGLVPGATIKLQPKVDLTDKATAAPAPQQTTSDGEGHFAFTGVAPGSYTLLISATGLESFVSNAILLHTGERFDVPDVALPIASANTSVDVAANTSVVAEEELKLESQQRILGVFPNFYTSFIYNAAPLNAKQKFHLSFHAITDPVVFISTAIVAGVEQYRDTFPGYGDDAASFGKRYGAAYGDAVIGRLFGSAVYPSLFHQDPRYFYMGPANPVRVRLIHAIESGVIVRGDNGHRQPNYSHILGNATAGAISTVYHPDSNSAGSLALRNALIGIAGTAVQGLLREFLWPHATHHIPPYAKGKPATLPEAPATPTTTSTATTTAATHTNP